MTELPPLTLSAQLAPVLADRMTELARQRGSALAQLALAWVMAKSGDIVPSPGPRVPSSWRRTPRRLL
ncbi:MAG TPA: hypothetical protein VGI74_16355 [Streptosporangiaceae bacterium]